MQQRTEPITATQALVALGANLPGAQLTQRHGLIKALDLLSQNAGCKVTASRLFRTPAVPAGSGPDYLNAAAIFCWSGTPEALLTLLNTIERQLGRTRGTRWEARIMDLDLIALGDAVRPNAATQARWAALPLARAAVEVPDRLILPHPRMADRSFVLVPLADIAPDWRHPLTGLSVAQMLADRPAAERAGIVPVPWPDRAAPSPLSFQPPGDT